MRIAIVRLSALGDIIQSMIILQFIKKGLPNCEIDWVVDEKFSEIVKLNSLISNVINVNLSEFKKQKNFFSLFATLKRLRKLEKYDYVFDIQGLIKSAVISRLIPSYKTIGYDKKSVRESLASSFYSEKYSIPYEKNVVVRYCELVEKSLMIKITKHDILNKEPFFALDRKKESKQKIISIVVGASFESKIYPLSNYQVLVDNIDAKFICLWGNNNEFTKAQEFSKNNLNVEVSKKTSMKELLDIICSSDLVIGGDTGPTHLAWANNIPSITLFGPTPGNRNVFQTKINLRVESTSTVNPLKINKNDFSINEINPKYILETSKDLLSN